MPERQLSSSLDSTLKRCQIFKTEHTACWKEHHSSSLHGCFPLRLEGESSLQTAHECSPTSTPLQLTEGHAVGWQQSPETHSDFSSHGPALEKHIHLPPSLDRNYSITCPQQGLNHSHTQTPRAEHVSALSKQGITLNTRAAP